MVCTEDMPFPGGTGVPYSSLCIRKVPMNMKAHPKTVGSLAYVQLPTFVAHNA